MSEISCETCVGACCTYLMKIPLSRDEAQTLTEAGTSLSTILEADPKVNWSVLADTLPSETDYDQEVKKIASGLAEGLGYYSLLSDCGFLSEPAMSGGMRKCSIFGQPNRPAQCSNFTVGNPVCVVVRLTHGVF